MQGQRQQQKAENRPSVVPTVNMNPMNPMASVPAAIMGMVNGGTNTIQSTHAFSSSTVAVAGDEDEDDEANAIQMLKNPTRKKLGKNDVQLCEHMWEEKKRDFPEVESDIAMKNEFVQESLEKVRDELKDLARTKLENLAGLGNGRRVRQSRAKPRDPEKLSQKQAEAREKDERRKIRQYKKQQELQRKAEASSANKRNMELTVFAVSSLEKELSELIQGAGSSITEAHTMALNGLFKRAQTLDETFTSLQYDEDLQREAVKMKVQLQQFMKKCAESASQKPPPIPSAVPGEAVPSVVLAANVEWAHKFLRSLTTAITNSSGSAGSSSSSSSSSRDFAQLLPMTKKARPGRSDFSKMSNKVLSVALTTRLKGIDNYGSKAISVVKELKQRNAPQAQPQLQPEPSMALNILIGEADDLLQQYLQKLQEVRQARDVEGSHHSYHTPVFCCSIADGCFPSSGLGGIGVKHFRGEGRGCSAANAVFEAINHPPSNPSGETLELDTNISHRNLFFPVVEEVAADNNTDELNQPGTDDDDDEEDESETGAPGAKRKRR